jgi:hypothetical protein
MAAAGEIACAYGMYAGRHAKSPAPMARMVTVGALSVRWPIAPVVTKLRAHRV